MSPVRWLTEKPDEWISRHRRRLRQHYIPLIHEELVDDLHTRIVQFTPIGVNWVPRGADPPTARPSGTLRRSIKKTYSRGYVANRLYGEVYTNNEYGPHVEYGTAPHVIRAKAGGSLYFYSPRSGSWQNRTSVKHPGTRGVHMFMKGASATRARIRPIGQNHLNRWAAEP